MKKHNKYKPGDILEGTYGPMKVVKDFLPPPEAMKKARMRIVHKNANAKEIIIHLKQDKLEFYNNQAKERNISSSELIEEILSTYAQKHE